jgi:hypothetical protein
MSPGTDSRRIVESSRWLCRASLRKVDIGTVYEKKLPTPIVDDLSESH